MYNSTCPICKCQAYQGFSSVECSNDKCTNFKGQPQIVQTQNTNPSNGRQGFIQVGIAIMPIPPPPPPHLITTTTGGFTAGISTKSTLLKGLLIDKKVYTHASPNYNIIEFIIITLDKLKKCCDEVCLAGGAARDVEMGRLSEIDDYDFFTTGFDQAKFNAEFAPGILTPANLKSSAGGSAVYPATNGTQTTRGNFAVFDFDYCGKKCQIINCSDIAEHIRQFDFGLNQIAINEGSFRGNPTLCAQLDIEITPEFYDDEANKTLTVFPDRLDVKQFKKLKERSVKMLAKFPNHQIKVG